MATRQITFIRKSAFALLVTIAAIGAGVLGYEWFCAYFAMGAGWSWAKADEFKPMSSRVDIDPLPPELQGDSIRATDGS